MGKYSGAMFSVSRRSPVILYSVANRRNKGGNRNADEKKAERAVPEQKNIFQVKLNFNTDTGEISAGSFVFDQGLTLEESKEDWMKNRKEYQERANKTMMRHYEFYRSIFNEEYVTSGSVLTCSNSDDTITIQLPEDHGIIAANGKPLLTCKDCKAGVHIASFGICKCKPEVYTYLGHHPSELLGAEQADGRGKYKCFPILGHDWITKNQDYMISVFDHEAYEAALEKDAFLVCRYGGFITIAEVPDAHQDELPDESTVPEEPVVPEESDNDFFDNFHYDWMRKVTTDPSYVTPEVTPEFMKKVYEISMELEIDPDDLMAVMSFESWFNPACGEGTGGAVGLTQFTQVSIDEINRIYHTNYTKEDIVKMNAIDQLDVVYLLFEPHKDKINGLTDVYMAVIAPARIGQDDDAIMYSQENSPSYYKENKELDKDHKGYITVGDAVAAVIQRRDSYGLLEN